MGSIVYNTVYLKKIYAIFNKTQILQQPILHKKSYYIIIY